MSRRDSDSKRRHSRFDRQPREQRHKDADSKRNDADAPQHDERASAGQIGRSSGRRNERGWWKDSRIQHNERAETSHGRELKDEKSPAKPNDSTFQKKDGYSERKDHPVPTSRKRPAFREEKIAVNSGVANSASTVAVKSNQIDHPPERNEKKEERSSKTYHLDILEKPFANDRAPNRAETRKDGFPSRGRYSGNGNYRGGDKFNGRQGYRPSKAQTEKWRHDLYHEVNKDPIPQIENDQIAKLEALLAS